MEFVKMEESGAEPSCSQEHEGLHTDYLDMSVIQPLYAETLAPLLSE